MCVNKSNGRATIMNIQSEPGFFSEDIMLDISTLSCHISSSAVVAERDMPWDAYISECCEKEIVYYVDQEQFRLQMQPENILRELKASGICSFHFRVNSGADFDWAYHDCGHRGILRGAYHESAPYRQESEQFLSERKRH